MRRIVLISCVSKKGAQAARAADLYMSPLFKMNLKYARQLQPDMIYILSAKYGLVELDQVIEPYNVTLNTLPVVAIKSWAATILAALQAKIDINNDEFIFLAGERYRRYLVPHLHHYQIPLQGLGIGKQLGQLKRWLS